MPENLFSVDEETYKVNREKLLHHGFQFKYLTPSYTQKKAIPISLVMNRDIFRSKMIGS